MVSAIIFFGSQTEGRFLEDPYLWFAAGLAVAIEAILRNDARGAEARTRHVRVVYLADAPYIHTRRWVRALRAASAGTRT